MQLSKYSHCTRDMRRRHRSSAYRGGRVTRAKTGRGYVGTWRRNVRLDAHVITPSSTRSTTADRVTEAEELKRSVHAAAELPLDCVAVGKRDRERWYDDGWVGSTHGDRAGRVVGDDHAR